MSVPITVEPCRKSTPTMVPSLSVAFASIVIDAGAVNDAPAVGLVIETFGSWLTAVLTVTVTGANAKMLHKFRTPPPAPPL